MKPLFSFFLIFLGSSLFAQADYDPRLLARYSEDRIAELQREQPSILEYWTYYLDNAYIIVDSEATGKHLKADETIKIKDIENFNILELDIHMDRNHSKVYQIKGTPKYLLLHSNKTFSELFSRHRNQSK
jgi:hypothetical protein